MDVDRLGTIVRELGQERALAGCIRECIEHGKRDVRKPALCGDRGGELDRFRSDRVTPVMMLDEARLSERAQQGQEAALRRSIALAEPGERRAIRQIGQEPQQLRNSQRGARRPVR